MDESYKNNDSTQEERHFSDEWSAFFGESSQTLDDRTLNLLNSLSTESDQGVLQFSHNTTATEFMITNENEIIQVIGNELLLNETLCPKDEPIESSSIIQLPEPSNLQYKPSSLPASQNWPGEYDFAISFSPQKKKKGVSWTYSQENDKLYVNKGIPCPINFSTNRTMPNGVKIRAMALYSSPDSATEVVKRCYNHSIEDKNKNILEADHLVLCHSDMAQYEVDPTTKRYSVIIPFENPAAGQSFSTYIYKFACFGSCTGLNRRPLMLVFSLEKDNQVIGRRKLDFKICACPGRDSKSGKPEQEKISKKRKKNQVSNNVPDISVLAHTSTSSISKKARTAQTPDGFYHVKVKDYKCYEFLDQMRKYYELLKTIKNLPPDVKLYLENYQKRKGYGINLGT